jgi:CDP-glycerol glycerophosphotransferase (TagB/SpsB family)
LKLKVVIASEKYKDIDNLFYNIEYINYIFLGHGVTYIKSYLYMDYLSPKCYNKILLPPSKIFVDIALNAGWKNEDIIKIGYPRWDKYDIWDKIKISTKNGKTEYRSIFLMFTWRKIKRGKKLSPLYFDNLFNLLNNSMINYHLFKNKVRLFFCYHHELREKRFIKSINDNIKMINQTDISTLLKNSSLIITDFSSIIFDTIVQRKPLILFIPDANDSNLKDIYDKNYYETIQKIKNRQIVIDEIFIDLNKVVNKIIYYIKNDFILEDNKIKLYEKYNLKNGDNTNKFIQYIKSLK